MCAILDPLSPATELLAGTSPRGIFNRAKQPENKDFGRSGGFLDAGDF